MLTRLINGLCLDSTYEPACLTPLAYKGINFCYYCLICDCNYMFITIFMVVIIVF